MTASKEVPGSTVWRAFNVAALMFLFLHQAAVGQPIPPGGCTNCPPYSPPPPDTRRNLVKYMEHQFSVLDTNSVLSDFGDTNLYNALAAMPTDPGTNPVLAATIYGDSVLLKASHFDYSAESRDFALLVCDSPGKPTWKTIDYFGASDAQDGWVVQGNVPQWMVTDPMFMQVSNVTTDRAPTFFRAIPYSGPVIAITGANPGDTVSNTVTLYATITDLSGATNYQFSVNVDGIPARYQLGHELTPFPEPAYGGNDISIQTPYNPNGSRNVNILAIGDVRAYQPTNPPADQKTGFQGSTTLPLDFENTTYLAFQSDNCQSDVGTNNILFWVDQPKQVTAAIIDPATHLSVASYAAFMPNAGNVDIAWNFTEADGVTPYSNTTYVVTFNAAADTNTLTVTNTIVTDGIRPGGGCFLTYMYENPTALGGWGQIMNDRADQVIDGDLSMLYQDIYDSSGFTQYGVGDIGPNRNKTKCMAYTGQPSGWIPIIDSLTNIIYSELTIAQAHGTGNTVGGGGYLPYRFDSGGLQGNLMEAGSNWRLRKAAFWCCYAGNPGAPLPGTGLDYPMWSAACGIRSTPTQWQSLGYKNCGLFFLGMLPRVGYGSSANQVTCQVASS